MAERLFQVAAATEATPLLAASPVAPVLDEHQPLSQAETLRGSPEEASLLGSGDDGGDDDDDLEGKPLPRSQIMLLCYARMVEPIAFFSIFPYINQMLLRNGNLAEADVGFYSGLVESLFSLTQMCVMMFWGRAADRFGRKPVLVGSLVGVSITTSLFGLATSIWQMVVFRCFAGVFAGTIVTIRVMISEHSTPKTQARSFSWFGFAGNMGILFGPFLGGLLADPAAQYPRVFAGIPFFEEYPYALSSFIVGLIGLTAVVTSALFVEETLPAEIRAANRREQAAQSQVRPDATESGSSQPLPQQTYRSLLRSPGVRPALLTYGYVMLLAFAYTAVVPVFWFTKPSLGGFGFTPLLMAAFMGLSGFSQAAWLLLVFPWLQGRVGTNGVIRACVVAWPFFFAIMPLLNTLLRIGTDASRSAFWVVSVAAMIVGPGVSMAFTGVQLLLNDVAPDARALSTLNAMALALTSGLRSFSPALFTSIFAFSARESDWLLGGYFIWVVMVGMGLGLAAYVFGVGLPEGEGKGLGGGGRSSASDGKTKQKNKNMNTANGSGSRDAEGYGTSSAGVREDQL
ncbi:transmembrane transporter-like protein [Microdochium nivale]|nr:transmembrane transporter-like protein [Microdochium nivale]